ncbi:MAG: HD domain-containing protein [Lachnospiraceae bacterium]
MEPAINQAIGEMISYYAGDPRRIQHFLKVHSFARWMGAQELLPADEMLILELAALMHDIGIKESENKYGTATGKQQEKEGPPLARVFLQNLGVDKKVTERVCYLVAHHHTYRNVAGKDYQILIEADFLVNAYEDQLEREAIEAAEEKIFTTKTGKWLLKRQFLT